MSDDAARPNFPLLPPRFIPKPVPGPEEPFEYPKALAHDDGGTDGADDGGGGSTQAESSFEKCRKFLVKSDDARAQEWNDGIQTQLVVVRSMKSLPKSSDALTLGEI